jgi:hypothetical protein
MSSDYNLKTFKAITSFTIELNDMFGNNHHPLKLYFRLLNKTTFSHEKAIQKHIDAFKAFCVSNRHELVNKNKNLKTSKVEYSSRVYIDFSEIFKLCDRETENAIWQHLLTISALVDPSGKAKEILKNESKSNEVDFLSSIIDKVGDKIDPSSKNPMEAVSQIISSGVFTDLISGMGSGMKDGSLDLGKMMGTVQKLCSTMNTGQSEGGAETMNMINSLVGNMLGPKNGDGSSAGPGGMGGLDLGAILGGLNLNMPQPQQNAPVTTVVTETIIHSNSPEIQQVSTVIITSNVEENVSNMVEPISNSSTVEEL